jgi:hypothetical protein
MVAPSFKLRPSECGLQQVQPQKHARSAQRTSRCQRSGGHIFPLFVFFERFRGQSFRFACLVESAWLYNVSGRLDLLVAILNRFGRGSECSVVPSGLVGIYRGVIPGHRPGGLRPGLCSVGPLGRDIANRWHQCGQLNPDLGIAKFSHTSHALAYVSA